MNPTQLSACPACETELPPARLEPHACPACGFGYDWHTRVFTPRSRFGIWAVFTVLVGFQPALLQMAYVVLTLGAVPRGPTLFFGAVAIAGWFWLGPRWSALLQRRKIFVAATPLGLRLRTLTRDTTIPYNQQGLLRVRFGIVIVEDRARDESIWLEFLTPTDRDVRSLLGEIDRARERYGPAPEQRTLTSREMLPRHLR